MTKKDIVLVYTLNRPETIEQIVKFIESKGFKIDMEANYGDGSTGIAFIEEANKK
jgi:hypothetical protein